MSQQYLFDEANHTFSNVELWGKPESQYIKGQQSETSKYDDLQPNVTVFSSILRFAWLHSQHWRSPNSTTGAVGLVPDKLTGNNQGFYMYFLCFLPQC